jgi:hypothetical protein
MRAAIRVRLTGRMTVVMVSGVIVALLAVIAASSSLTRTFSTISPWATAHLVAIIVVTGAVGLVVAGHQPGNPIGWLLAGESVFILVTIAGGFGRSWCTSSATTTWRSLHCQRWCSISCSARR